MHLSSPPHPLLSSPQLYTRHQLLCSLRIKILQRKKEKRGGRKAVALSASFSKHPRLEESCHCPNTHLCLGIVTPSFLLRQEVLYTFQQRVTNPVVLGDFFHSPAPQELHYYKMHPIQCLSASHTPNVCSISSHGTSMVTVA